MSMFTAKDTEDLAILFTGFALAGASANLQQHPAEIAKRCADIGMAARDEIIQRGLIEGAKPVARPQFASPFQPPAGQPKAAPPLMAVVETARAAGIKGVPGDGTFSKEQLAGIAPANPVTGG